MDFIIFTSTKYLAFWALYYSLNMKKILSSAKRISGMRKQERLEQGRSFRSHYCPAGSEAAVEHSELEELSGPIAYMKSL